MARKLEIDFVSDVVCPWCVVGLGALREALAELGDEVEPVIRFRPFELNPDMGPEGENVAEHVARKYGSTPEQSAASRKAITEAGAKYGFVFSYAPDSRIWNTFDAHRLLHWAGEEGDQLAMKEALFKANFTDRAAMNETEALVGAAETAGMDPARAREILASDAYAEDVKREEMLARRGGINAVPSIIFDGKWLLQGAQPPEVFVKSIREVLAAE